MDERSRRSRPPVATLNLGDQSNSSTNAWSNTGTITATNSTVNLGGLVHADRLGDFNRTGGDGELSAARWTTRARRWPWTPRPARGTWRAAR